VNSRENILIPFKKTAWCHTLNYGWDIDTGRSVTGSFIISHIFAGNAFKRSQKSRKNKETKLIIIKDSKK
jgi:hypothetical protein